MTNSTGGAKHLDPFDWSDPALGPDLVEKPAPPEAVFPPPVSRQADHARMMRQAEQRLDMLIGRQIGQIALDLHWPSAQVADVLGFLETGMVFFESHFGAGGEQGRTSTGNEAEVSFFSRELPAALREARKAVGELRHLSASLRLLGQDAQGTPRIWSPSELLGRVTSLTRPIWRRNMILDTSGVSMENCRVTLPARPVLLALVETVISISRTLPRTQDEAGGTLGLYRDDDNGLHFLFECPPFPVSTAAPPTAVEAMSAIGSRITVQPTARGTSIRLDLPGG